MKKELERNQVGKKEMQEKDKVNKRFEDMANERNDKREREREIEIRRFPEPFLPGKKEKCDIKQLGKMSRLGQKRKLSTGGVGLDLPTRRRES